MTVISEISQINIDYFSDSRIAAGKVYQNKNVHSTLQVTKDLSGAPGYLIIWGALGFGGLADDTMIRVFIPDYLGKASSDSKAFPTNINTEISLIFFENPVSTTADTAINLGDLTTTLAYNSASPPGVYVGTPPINGVGYYDFKLPAGKYFGLRLAVSQSDTSMVPAAIYTLSAPVSFLIDTMVS